MKFIFADSQDYVDPGFDFQNEAYSADRRVQHDDVYPHEFLSTPLMTACWFRVPQSAMA